MAFSTAVRFGGHPAARQFRWGARSRAAVRTPTHTHPAARRFGSGGTQQHGGLGAPRAPPHPPARQFAHLPSSTAVRAHTHPHPHPPTRQARRFGGHTAARRFDGRHTAARQFDVPMGGALGCYCCCLSLMASSTAVRCFDGGTQQHSKFDGGHPHGKHGSSVRGVRSRAAVRTPTHTHPPARQFGSGGTHQHGSSHTYPAARQFGHTPTHTHTHPHGKHGGSGGTRQRGSSMFRWGVPSSTAVRFGGHPAARRFGGTPRAVSMGGTLGCYCCCLFLMATSMAVRCSMGVRSSTAVRCSDGGYAAARRFGSGGVPWGVIAAACP